MQIHK